MIRAINKLVQLGELDEDSSEWRLACEIAAGIRTYGELSLEEQLFYASEVAPLLQYLEIESEKALKWEGLR